MIWGGSKPLGARRGEKGGGGKEEGEEGGKEGEEGDEKGRNYRRKSIIGGGMLMSPYKVVINNTKKTSNERFESLRNLIKARVQYKREIRSTDSEKTADLLNPRFLQKFYSIYQVSGKKWLEIIDFYRNMWRKLGQRIYFQRIRIKIIMRRACRVIESFSKILLSLGKVG